MAFKAGAIYGEAQLDTKKWNKGLKNIKKGAAVAGAAIAAAFVGAMTVAVKAANEFQIAMSNVDSIVDESVISMQALSKEILSLNPELGDVTELTNGLYQAFSAGAETAEEAMQVTVDSAMFAKAGLTDVNTAVDVLTTAVNAYGKETMNTTKAADIFFTTIKLGKVTGEQLASSIGTSIPLFASAGIKLEELASAVAAMTKQGVKANVATTQLNSIVSAFLKPSEEMIALLDELGWTSGAAFLEAEGLAGALELLEETTQGDAAAMAELIPNVRALRGTMALTGVGGVTFNETLVAMETAAGATAKAFGEQEKTFETFMNSMNRNKVVIGNIAKMFVDKLAVGATTAANSFFDFIMSARGMELVAKIAGFVSGAFTLIKDAFLFLWRVWKDSMKPVWDALKTALDDIFGGALDGAGGMKIFATALQGVATIMTVSSKVMVFLIRLIADLVLSVKASAEVVGEFLSFKWVGKKGREELKAKADQAGQAFATLGKNFAINIVDIYQTVKDEIATFSDETEALTEELTVNIKTSVKSTTDFVVANYGEMTTGFAEYAEDVGEMSADLTVKLAEADEFATEGKEELLEEELMTQNKAWEIQKTGWIDSYKEIFTGYFKVMEKKEAALEAENVITTAAIAARVAEAEGMQTALAAMEDKRVDDINKNYDQLESNTEDTTDELELTWNDYFSKLFDGFKGLYQSFKNIMRAFSETSMNIMQLKHQNELTELKKSFDDGLIEEEEYDKSKLALEKTQNSEMNDLKEKAFNADKANRIAGVWMDLASSIMGWWAAASKLGPIAGPIFAGVMTGLASAAAVAQSIAIGKQKFVPSKAEGGMASGVTRINERGGEIVNLPDNSLVIPNDISKQIANSVNRSDTIINVSFDGARIDSEMDLEKVTTEVARKLGKQMRLVG